MATEIERKFLVASSAWESFSQTRIHIRQFYLADHTGRSIRIRISDNREAWLTLKFASPGPGREEYEYPIPVADAQEMLAFGLGRVIAKTRHHVSHGGYLYEVDVFEDELAGLVVAELETPDRVPSERLPAWLGREVTDDARYYNAQLALAPLPDIAALRQGSPG